MKSIFSSDPGAMNELPTSGGEFSPQAYLSRQAQLISDIDPDLVKESATILESVVSSGGRVYFCGNAGSFGIAEHMVCDYAKGLRRTRSTGFDALCLGANGCLSSALTNDFGHEFALAAELEMYSKPGDAVVAISSSGNSKNILNAVNYANRSQITTIGLDGFGGGKLTSITHHSYTSRAKTYPEVEACHQIFLDAVAFCLWGDASE